jgi:hypothetical protein
VNELALTGERVNTVRYARGSNRLPLSAKTEGRQ